MNSKYEEQENRTEPETVSANTTRTLPTTSPLSTQIIFLHKFGGTGSSGSDIIWAFPGSSGLDPWQIVCLALFRWLEKKTQVYIDWTSTHSVYLGLAGASLAGPLSSQYSTRCNETVFFCVKKSLYPAYIMVVPSFSTRTTHLRQHHGTYPPTHTPHHHPLVHPFPPTLCSGLVIKLSVELGFEKCTPDSTSGSPLMFRIHYVIISEAIVTCVALPINYHYTRPLVKPVGRPWADHVHFRSQLSGCIGLSLGLNQTLRQAWITITSGIMVTENILFLIL